MYTFDYKTVNLCLHKPDLNCNCFGCVVTGSIIILVIPVLLVLLVVPEILVIPAILALWLHAGIPVCSCTCQSLYLLPTYSCTSCPCCCMRHHHSPPIICTVREVRGKSMWPNTCRPSRALPALLYTSKDEHTPSSSVHYNYHISSQHLLCTCMSLSYCIKYCIKYW